MLIYNITFHIEDHIQDEALFFIKTRYIPEATAGGMLFNPRLCRIMPAHKGEGISYSVQFYVKSQGILNDWKKETGDMLHQKIASLFENKVLGFTTILEDLDLSI